VVQVHPPDPVMDVRDQRVVSRLAGQLQRGAEVCVCRTDLAAVETCPAGQVVQVGQRDG
jgi:hypothetical protein